MQLTFTFALFITQTFLFFFSLFGIAGYSNVYAQNATREVSKSSETESRSSTQNPWGSDAADQSEMASLGGLQRQQAINSTTTNSSIVVPAAGIVVPPSMTTAAQLPAAIITVTAGVITTTTAAPSGNATTLKSSADAVGVNSWLLLTALLFSTTVIGLKRLTKNAFD